MQETVLARIVNDKKQWVQARQQQQPLSSFHAELTLSERCFYGALKQNKTVFILECKKASPSKGLIRHNFDPQQIAKVYGHYAAAISVLTDEKYFQGSFDYLTLVSRQVKQPVLCKDFIIDSYQIYLARYYQADAILLMLSVLDDNTYLQLRELAHTLNMGVLTEVSTQQELQRAIALNAKVVGINNRNLRDLSIDLKRTEEFAPQLPAGVTIISESGIYNNQQIRQLSPFVHGFLIGSALMSEENLDMAVRRVILGENKVCGLTREQDAQAAYRAGAMYGGLIFVDSSPRYITPYSAATLIAAAKLNWVGVFRQHPIDSLVNIATTLSLSAVQLHGNEDQIYINQLRSVLPPSCQIWLALSVKDHVPERTMQQVDRYVFDHGQGGSGQTFNWQLLENQIVNNVLLAGGLNLTNVTQAVTLGCAGLDFNSGVESRPGIKDAAKIDAVFAALGDYPRYANHNETEENHDIT